MYVVLYIPWQVKCFNVLKLSICDWIIAKYYRFWNETPCYNVIASILYCYNLADETIYVPLDMCTRVISLLSPF